MTAYSAEPGTAAQDALRLLASWAGNRRAHRLRHDGRQHMRQSYASTTPSSATSI
ncbi:hypothetical protein [Micromonospora sp. NPDC005237]|uniref:hypothetical protein n=1 Tax=Micromonospora sp. NPDC005237 TaxID=3155113 RepID=UPI0033BD75A7